MSDIGTVYELRKLCTKDIFPMSKILSKIGIKEFKECFASEEVQAMIESMSKGEKPADIESVGIAVVLEIADVFLGNLSACEDHIYQLLSGLSGMTKKEIAELPMDVFVSMIIDVIKKEEFKDFIKAVSKSLK